ncbi:hypothetical protein [Streptomyces sp. GS7]|uniref:hypothetical protein n=1 Tax=Streptomyces sp. GS7 TaxID=2692234 RepID=UPI001315EED0|nr:hypothetical protein [Streptomyces sp. GS7]QHC23031.1 hypothetical protein GR130_18065 [Streptomyces sp. GS7]
MTSAPAAAADPLAPVRAALVRAADEEAERLVAAARRDAEATVAAARSRSAALLREARHRGQREGARAAAAAVAQAHRSARAGLLKARAEAYDELCRTVFAQVRRCRREAAYPTVRDRLAGQARRVLGPEATVTEHPHGGVIGTADGRSADLSLDAVAGRVLERCGAGIETLWQT